MRLGDGGLEANLFRMHVFVAPFAGLIFWALVDDARLLLFPPMAALVTLLVTFALTKPMAEVVPVSPDFLATTAAISLAFNVRPKLWIDVAHCCLGRPRSLR
ncbi:unnamed protein product [Prorocentrum cordatum]|uniref:Dolichyl-diphosphooligosaccharide--protein glycotransferase n=1 Tax=Prorocentrum cordatum TaxID=2364126 RepID=A0ABN9RK29_9DINO|nr:unnamed protein product [Polarella glacialis]